LYLYNKMSSVLLNLTQAMNAKRAWSENTAWNNTWWGELCIFFYQNKSMFSSSVFTGEFCALKFHLLSFRTTLLSAWQSYSHCCLELFKEMPPCHNNLIWYVYISVDYCAKRYGLCPARLGQEHITTLQWGGCGQTVRPSARLPLCKEGTPSHQTLIITCLYMCLDRCVKRCGL